MLHRLPRRNRRAQRRQRNVDLPVRQRYAHTSHLGVNNERQVDQFPRIWSWGTPMQVVPKLSTNTCHGEFIENTSFEAKICSFLRRGLARPEVGGVAPCLHLTLIPTKPSGSTPAFLRLPARFKPMGLKYCNAPVLLEALTGRRLRQ